MRRKYQVDHISHTRTPHNRFDSPHKGAIADPTATHKSCDFRLDESCANQEPLANLDFHLNEHPRVGEYHLIELLGQGGQGEIWKALRTEPRIEFVALKLLSRKAKNDHASRARFRARLSEGHTWLILESCRFSSSDNTARFSSLSCRSCTDSL